LIGFRPVRHLGATHSFFSFCTLAHTILESKNCLTPTATKLALTLIRIVGSSRVHIEKMGNDTGAREAEAGPFHGDWKKCKIVMKLPQCLKRILACKPTPVTG